MPANTSRPTICVFGAGAIGGLVAAKQQAADTAVSVVARGDHLAALQRDGLTLHSAGVRTVTHPRAVAHGGEIGPQDYLLLTLKAHSIAPAIEQMRPLIGPGTTIVAMANGIPWWYPYGLPGPFASRRVQAVDPDGALWTALPPSQCLGCVLYPTARVAAPGVVEHLSGNRLALGEPDGTRSDRAARLAGLLGEAGFDAPVRLAIRDDLWLKLRASIAVNPISALTTATMDVVASDEDSRPAVRSLMQEGEAVGEALGATFSTGIDQQIEMVSHLGHHKTSMLQDIEASRPLEVEAILGSAVEMAKWVDVSVPVCETVLALLRQRATLSANPG